MQRTRNPQLTLEKPSLILCSDIHLREDTPTCWTGDFQEEQWKSLSFIKGLQEFYNCPVVHAGDLFHHWKPSPWLLSMAMMYLPSNFYTVYGQHDLPQHNWELREKSGIYCLEGAGKITVIGSGHYGEILDPNEGGMLGPHGKIYMVWHYMTYITPPFPGATGGQATGLLKKYTKLDLLVTGDNHQSFSTEYQGRLLVNTGSMTRQDADQIDFHPRVALWYAETNTIKWVNIPIQKDVITREYIERIEKRDERIEAFVSRLDMEWVSGQTIEETIEEVFARNNIHESVKQIVWSVME